MIEKQRIKKLNNNCFQKNKYIIYWMQQSQRTEHNHAFEYSKQLANKHDKNLIVFFGLTDNYPDANLRHYSFMLDGLKEVQNSLEKQNIKFLIQKISPEKGIIKLCKQACIIIVDRGYLKIQKKWRNLVAKEIKCPLIQVESDSVVPVETASEKEEYSAATIRKKINNKLNDFLKPVKKIKYKKNYYETKLESLDISDKKKILSKLNIDNTVKPVEKFIGGTCQADKILKDFILNKLETYSEKKNDPNEKNTSDMSPYLHFGQISPVYIALKIKETQHKAKEGFLEELIVRRELSNNYVFYNKDYDLYEGLPNWAKKSLKKHEQDKREYTYKLEEFEKAETHDPYWNAAQKQMINTGKMHGYMRMYWGKKIIEWTKKPKDAFKIAIYLNNKYELDGRDPNAFTGVAWCFGKHDRPWTERSVFGNIRYMNSNGLKRKFNADLYSKKYKKII